MATMTTEERLQRFLTREPVVASTAYIASDATVIGAVTIGDESSVWPRAVLRGDINTITIGSGSNIQDGAVVHLADDYDVVIGNDVTIGHMAMIHACRIGDRCLIGMSATILDGAVIGEESVVGAGALVTKGMVVPPRSLVFGMPAKVVRELSEEEIASLLASAEKYRKVARAHKALQTSGGA